MTYRLVVYDLLKSLRKNFDDGDFTVTQILYWVTVIENKLIYEFSQKEGESDLYLSTFYPVKIKTDSRDRKYLDVPGEIIELPNNGGIAFMSYSVDDCACGGSNITDSIFFNSVKSGELQHIAMDEYTKPKPTNPYYYRIGANVNGVKGDRLYILGFDCVDIDCVELGIHGISDPSKLCSLDDKMKIPSQYIHEIQIRILRMGAFILTMPEERTNIGADLSEEEYQVPASITDSKPDKTIEN